MTRFGKLLTAAVLVGTPATALASPRTLMSGAPACGNTMGKGKSYGDDCTAEERAEWRAARQHEYEQEVAAARAKERAQRIAAAKREQMKALKKKADSVAEIARLTLESLTRPLS